jgi:hypothetical protein
MMGNANGLKNFVKRVVLPTPTGLLSFNFVIKICQHTFGIEEKW